MVVKFIDMTEKLDICLCRIHGFGEGISFDEIDEQGLSKHISSLAKELLILIREYEEELKLSHNISDKELSICFTKQIKEIKKSLKAGTFDVLGYLTCIGEEIMDDEIDIRRILSEKYGLFYGGEEQGACVECGEVYDKYLPEQKTCTQCDFQKMVNAGEISWEEVAQLTN